MSALLGLFQHGDHAVEVLDGRSATVKDGAPMIHFDLACFPRALKGGYLSRAAWICAQVDIQADDRRLAQLYPGTAQQRPGSIRYVAVSAVGFSETKTEALVYARERGSGSFVAFEKQGGAWTKARTGDFSVCRWAV